MNVAQNDVLRQFVKLLEENGRPAQAQEMTFLLLYMNNMSQQSPVMEQLTDAADCPPDDAATPDDMEAIKQARAEYARGETIPHDAIN